MKYNPDLSNKTENFPFLIVSIEKNFVNKEKKFVIFIALGNSVEVTGFRQTLENLENLENVDFLKMSIIQGNSGNSIFSDSL